MKFNNKLAVVLVSLIVALWIVNGTGLVNLAGEVIGVTISAFTMLVTFYFRKKPEETS